MLYDELDRNGVVVRSGIVLGMYDTLPDGHQWVPYVPDLALVKTGRKLDIEAWRDAACCAPCLVPVGGVSHTWQADERSQALLSNAVNLAGAGVIPAPVVWRTADNINVTVTLADLKAIAATIAAQTQAAYTHSWNLKAQVDAAAAIADVQLIVW